MSESRQQAEPQVEAQDVVNRVIGPSIRVKDLGDDLNAGLPPALYERKVEEHGRWCEVAQERERALVDALAAFIEEKDAEDWYATHCQEPGAAERLHNAYQAGREALSALRGEQR